MTEKIPTAIAAEIISLRMRADAATVHHMVLHEAVALLIGDLHHRGCLDGWRLAQQLEQAMSAPEIQEIAPDAPEAAALLAGRIRHAAGPMPPPEHEQPQSN